MCVGLHLDYPWALLYLLVSKDTALVGFERKMGPPGAGTAAVGSTASKGIVTGRMPPRTWREVTERSEKREACKRSQYFGHGGLRLSPFSGRTTSLHFSEVLLFLAVLISHLHMRTTHAALTTLISCDFDSDDLCLFTVGKGY